MSCVLLEVRGKLCEVSSTFPCLLGIKLKSFIWLIEQTPVGWAISQHEELLSFLRLSFSVYKHDMLFHLFFFLTFLELYCIFGVVIHFFKKYSVYFVFGAIINEIVPSTSFLDYSLLRSTSTIDFFVYWFYTLHFSMTLCKTACLLWLTMI